MEKNFTNEEIYGLARLIAMMDSDNRKLRHPIATLNLIMALDPDMEFIKRIYPWLEEQENNYPSLEDIVRQLLRSFDIQEQKIDEAINTIRELNMKDRDE